MERLQAFEGDSAPFVLFDTLDSPHLAIIGDVLTAMSAEQPLFVVGSSGIEYALAEAWQKQGLISPLAQRAKPSPVDQLVVMSGSASPVNQRQIEAAEARGAVGQRINTSRLVNPATVDEERALIMAQALDYLATGRSLMLYTALGPDDPSIAETLAQLTRLGLSPTQTSEILGRQQGLILNALIEKTGLTRVCVAGGDTSGHTAAAMGIDALEFIASIAPGAPLCRASSHIAANNAIEITFKGGQNGGEDYFELLQRGGS
jgi:3-oxoisoapionate kinase